MRTGAEPFDCCWVKDAEVEMVDTSDSLEFWAWLEQGQNEGQISQDQGRVVEMLEPLKINTLGTKSLWLCWWEELLFNKMKRPKKATCFVPEKIESFHLAVETKLFSWRKLNPGVRLSSAVWWEKSAGRWMKLQLANLKKTKRENATFLGRSDYYPAGMWSSGQTVYTRAPL